MGFQTEGEGMWKSYGLLCDHVLSFYLSRLGLCLTNQSFMLQIAVLCERPQT